MCPSSPSAPLPRPAPTFSPHLAENAYILFVKRKLKMTMEKGLLIQSLSKFLLGAVIIGLLLFLSAGSLHYWQGWLLMGILFVPMFCAGLVLMAKNPELLDLG